MGNCANKPVTMEGEAPEQKADEVVVESREIVAGEVEAKTEGDSATEEAISTELPEEVTSSKAEEEATTTKEAELEKAAEVEAQVEQK